jgi:hypothetical protein
VGLERGPLSLVRIIEELLEWKSSGSGLENRDYRPLESVALTTRNSPRYPVDRRLGGPQNQSGRRRGEKILDPTETRTLTPSVVQPVASHYTVCAIPAPVA